MYLQQAKQLIDSITNDSEIPKTRRGNFLSNLSKTSEDRVGDERRVIGLFTEDYDELELPEDRVGDEGGGIGLFAEDDKGTRMLKDGEAIVVITGMKLKG